MHKKIYLYNFNIITFKLFFCFVLNKNSIKIKKNRMHNYNILHMNIANIFIYLLYLCCIVNIYDKN